MNREQSNQPAFSCVAVSPDGNSFHQEGLTKREYFAAMAMQGILSDQTHLRPNEAEEIVRRSVILADALLEQLNQQP